jgi:hypothetical protein
MKIVEADQATVARCGVGQDDIEEVIKMVRPS